MKGLLHGWNWLVWTLVATAILATWPVAHTYASTPAPPDRVQVLAAEGAAAPSVSLFGGAISRVHAGDLFIVDATGTGDETKVRLLLVNPHQLARAYRYMVLHIAVYARTPDGGWEKVTGQEGYITLRSIEATFELAGGATYKIAVEGGNISTFSGISTAGELSPRFYLEIK